MTEPEEKTLSPHELKQKAVEILEYRYEVQQECLADIDVRLDEYIRGCWEDSEHHNYYEILGAIKFLRLLRDHKFNQKKVQYLIRLREGVWKKQHGRWVHIEGGIPQPGTREPQVYRWQPFQVFVIASVFGFYEWIDTDLSEGRRDLLDTEKIIDGKIWDMRRLCTDFTFYGPRKTDKTGLSAYIQVIFFFLEDNNAEIYCAANAVAQSKLLFRRTKEMLRQLDTEGRLRLTETVCEWSDAWKSIRTSSIQPLSAGGKTKDGMFAQLCCADEYGSAGYVNGKSDMKMLVDVVQSSMGPRREPLTFTTTTAGRIQTGPFIEKLDAIHRLLEKELEWDDEDSEGPKITDDRVLCLCLEPDQWEKDDEELLLTSKDVRRKVNPMLGIIAQNQSYDDEIAKARMDGDTAEVISKYFNVYQSQQKLSEWVSSAQVKKKQRVFRIEDCQFEDGWDVYAAMDFSQGNDLHAITYLGEKWVDGICYQKAAMDAWINRETLQKSSIREVYLQWIEQGYLRLCDDDVFQPSLMIDRIAELDAAGVNFVAFGYDNHLSQDPVNLLKAWLYSKDVEADQLVIPVSQTYGNFNSAVDTLTYLLKEEGDLFVLDNNPLWIWQFGNVLIDEDSRMGNKKPVKRNRGSDSCKVDNIQCLAMCVILSNIA